MKNYERRGTFFKTAVIALSLGLLFSCSSIGYGRKVEQVGDHSFPAAGPVARSGGLKLDILEKIGTILDIQDLEEHQILCRGEITTPKPANIFYGKRFKDFNFNGNIITKEKQMSINLLFVVGALDTAGSGEKAVNFRFSSVKGSDFSVNYSPRNTTPLDDYNKIPRYPVELAVITLSGRPYSLYAVYEPLYETVPFFGKEPKKRLPRPLENMDKDTDQLKHNNQKYQIVNKEGKALAEVYNHTYQVFDSGDPVALDDATFCAGIVYTIVNVTHILESSTYWYK